MMATSSIFRDIVASDVSCVAKCGSRAAMRQSEAVIAASDAVREIAKALRNHVDPEALEKIANDLLDVPGDKIFRETIAQFTQALMTPPGGRL
jgi:leucyl aminopeptidase